MPSLTIPPLGAAVNDPGQGSAIVTWVNNLTREAAQGAAEWLEVADKSLNVYTYGDDPAPSVPDDVCVNEIQTSILAQTDIQTKEPPQATLEPVETGEPGDAFWQGPDAIGLKLNLPPECVTPQAADPLNPENAGAIIPPQPIPPDFVKGLQQYQDQGLIDEDWLVQVNDRTVTDVYQTVFDVHWQRCRADLWIRQNLLDTNIQGWTGGLYQFLDDRKSHRLMHMSPRQVYFDPTCRDIRDAAYAGIDLAMDADEAKALWPKVAAKIDQFSIMGTLRPPDSVGQLGSPFNDRQFYRNMIVLRVFWIRHQPIPLSVEDAVQSGRVQQQQRPQAIAPPTDPGIGETPAAPTKPLDIPMLIGLAEALGVDWSTIPQDQFIRGLQVEQEHADVLKGDDAALVKMVVAHLKETPQYYELLAQYVEPAKLANQQVGGAAPMEQFFVDAATGMETKPGEPSWPTKLGIRQIAVIASECVDDRECEFWDIPILHNVNIPLAGSKPFGIGEPYRLWAMQNANNRALRGLVNQNDFAGKPVRCMPKSVAEELQATYGSANVDSGNMVIVPDDMWQNFAGKIIETQPAAPLSDASVALHGILKSEITEQSGHSEVLQGRATSQFSGKAIELLQSSAASMIGFKSQRTGDMVYWLSRLMLHSLVNRLSLDDIRQIVSKYQPHILAAIIERARRMDWDIAVTVSAGSGALKAQKATETRENYKAGLITSETAREKLGIDHRQEERRQEKAVEKQMQMQARMMPQMQAAAGQAAQGQGQPQPQTGEAE